MRRTITDEDPYGPGSDLVLSLFVALLLMVALGAALSKLVPDPKQAELDLLLSREKRRDASKDMRPFFTLGGESFDQGSANLKDGARASITGRVQELKTALEQGEHEGQSINHVRVSGLVSPEVSPRVPASEQENYFLGVRRARSVMAQLLALGIPYECVVIEGLGWSTSDALRAYYQAHPRGTLREWDAEPKDQTELAKERRIEIALSYDPRSICPLALR